MAEFVLKSRKSEMTAPDFALEKLEKPGDSKLFEFFESKVKDIRPEKSSETPKNSTAPALEIVTKDAAPRLPWQLKRLISAACADVLPKDTAKLTAGIVPDLNRYVLGWGCAYLVSDRIEAERRLWEAHRAWKGVN